MSLERLVDEVRHRAEAELEAERARIAEEERTILREGDAARRAIADEAARATEAEAAKLLTGEVARAKVEARKLLFEARQRALERSLADARRRLGELAGTDEYAALVKRLFAYAVERLGKPVRVSGRSEDAALLKSVAGRSAVAVPVPIAGGIIVESGDGSRRLDLSFDELLRRREDELLDLARRTTGAPG